MEDGYFEGFIIVVILGIILAIVVKIYLKKQKKKIQKILSAMSQQMIDELVNAGFYIPQSDPNFLMGKCYIYDIVQKDGGVEIQLMYYLQPQEKKDEPFRLDLLYLNQNEFEKCDYIKIGAIVTTMHNRIVMPYKICKIVS